MTIKIATVFSGIGAPEYALKHLLPPESSKILFGCDCGECRAPLDDSEVKRLHRIEDDQERYLAVGKAYKKVRSENRVKDVYMANYHDDKPVWFDDIRFVDGKPYHGKVDLFVGGSPCQSFSLMGKRKGLADARGTLFFDYARLIKEIQPKVFIFENVPGMISHDKGNTWKVISSTFKSLGYDIHYEILSSENYGIPQRRKRLFVVGFLGLKKRDFEFPAGFTLTKKSSDFWETNPDARFYLGKKGFEFVTNPKYSGRASINQDIIRTEKRNQEFNWNGDFVFEKMTKKQAEKKAPKAYYGMYNGKGGLIRKLTVRECHSLMGFGSDFIISSHDIDAYKQAGNSIVINVISAIIKAILDMGEIS